MNRHQPIRRHGFTLVELSVALVVSAIVLLGARMMIEVLAGAAREATDAAVSADRQANADRFARGLFRMMETGPGLERPFGGDDRSIHFSSYCRTTGGWLERCNVVVGFARSGDTNLLVAHLMPDEPHGLIGAGFVRLAAGFHDGAFRYLNDPRYAGQWFLKWGDANLAPLAVGIVLDGDTAILRIGKRQ